MSRAFQPHIITYDSALGCQIIDGSLKFNSARTNYLKRYVSVDGNNEQGTINTFVDNMLSRDSLTLRREVARIMPDIELQQMVDIDGDEVEVTLPMSANFFWPSADI